MATPCSCRYFGTWCAGCSARLSGLMPRTATRRAALASASAACELVSRLSRHAAVDALVPGPIPGRPGAP